MAAEAAAMAGMLCSKLRREQAGSRVVDRGHETNAAFGPDLGSQSGKIGSLQDADLAPGLVHYITEASSATVLAQNCALSSRDYSRQNYFTDITQELVSRRKKAPDEAVWKHSGGTSELVKVSLAAIQLGGDGYQNAGACNGDVAAGNSVQRRLPQLKNGSWTGLISKCIKLGQYREAVRTYEEMRQKGAKANRDVFLLALKACSKLGDLECGKEIHSHMMETGKEFQVFVLNSLIDMYVKCGSMVDARLVFDAMQKRTEVSWNVMILGYAKKGEGELALEFYEQMQQEGFSPNDRTFVALLKACGTLSTQEMRLGKCRAVHSQVVQSGLGSDVFVGNTLIDMYAKCGSIVEARHVFDKLPHRDAISWSCMVFGYVEKQEGELALELFEKMQQEGVQPTERIFVGALKACSSLAALEEGIEVVGKFVKKTSLEKGRAIHLQAVKVGLESNAFVGSRLIDMYTKCGTIVDARRVFDKLPHRDVVSWNAMILGYAQKEEGESALQLYAQMQKEGVAPDDRTFVGALKACSSLAALEEGLEVDGKILKLGCLEKGRAIHSQVVKYGFEADAFVATTLVDMYTKCGSMADARHVFENLPHREVVSWAAMIFGNAEEQGKVALQLYAQMQMEGVVPNDRTYVGALMACGSLAALEEGTKAEGKHTKVGCLEKGRSIHSQVVKAGLESDLFVGTTIVDVYTKCGSMLDAWHVFEKLPRRNVVSYNVMILGYSEKHESEAALELYARMQQEGIVPDDRTFVGALKACGNLAAAEDGKQVDEKIVKVLCLEKGRAIHSQVVKSGFESDVFVGNTLIDMYAKCGSILDARRVFDNLRRRNVVSWTVMIAGYAEQEESAEALKLYAQMQQQRFPADSWTFVSILKACGNAAALENGKEIHVEIRRAGLETAAIVATALIDMYGKCGSMDEAQQLFDVLPTRDLVTWSALIAGYTRKGEFQHVFHLFERMRQESIRPDGVTFLSLLTVCSHVGLVDVGRNYFEAMSKDYGITPTIEHYTCMVDLLGRAGQLQEALAMVEEMPLQPTLVVWRTLLGACRKWNNVPVGRHAFDWAVRLDENNAASYVLMSNIYANARMWEQREKVQAMRKKVGAWKRPGQSWWTDIGGMVHTFLAGDTRHPDSQEIYSKLQGLCVKMREEGYVPHLDSVLWDISDDEKEDALCGHSEKLAIAYALLKTPPGTTIRIVKNLRVCDDCHAVTALLSKMEGRNIICRDSNRFHDFRDGNCSCGKYW